MKQNNHANRNPNSTVNVQQLAIRAVQLDLARQMETIPFIKSFCDFIAANGFNTLVLYLEARVKTKSFPYPASHACYTADEMRDVVSYAEKLGIDVIPVVSILGHAELFLQYDELAPLAELRNGIEGRFKGSTFKNMFCPSLPETHTFLSAYLKEVAEIFPSSYFHAGCDESWDVGCCDLCKQRLATGETESDIFAEHLSKYDELLSGTLGKRMLIWDDMFDLYPEALDRIPKSIIMCCWHYDVCPEQTVGHFNNRARNDPFKKYDKLGFEYLIATGGALPNITKLTDYGMPYSPLGALLTIWELQTSFMYNIYPSIAFAGKLWSGDGRAREHRQLYEEVVRELFGLEEPELIDALHAMSSRPEFKIRSGAAQRYLEFSERGDDYTGRALAQLLSHVLARYAGQIKHPLGKQIIDDFQAVLEHITIRYELEELAPHIILKSEERAAAIPKLSQIEDRIVQLAERRIGQWKRWRTDISPCHVRTQFEAVLKDVQSLSASAVADGRLHAYLCLPEPHSSQNSSFSVKYKDATDFEHVESGVYKGTSIWDCFYTKVMAVAPDRVPEAIKIETCGYGGQGYTFLRIINQLGRFVPSAVSAVTGQVSNPEYLLDHDLKWCFCGSQDTVKTFSDPKLAREMHTVVVQLKREDENNS